MTLFFSLELSYLSGQSFQIPMAFRISNALSAKFFLYDYVLGLNPG